MNEKIKTIENEPEAKIEIVQESAEQELSNLIKAYVRYNWYKNNGYSVELPDDPILDGLREEILQEVGDKELTQEEINCIVAKYYNNAKEKGCVEIIKAMINDQKNLEKMDKTKQAIIEKESLIKEGLNRLQKIKGFKRSDDHKINLRIVSPVYGQYNANNANIFIKAFEAKDDRVNTIQILVLHEMLHASIEDNIIKKYNLEHWEKERLVDLIISIVLPDICPGYHIQEKGEGKMNKYINQETVYDLPSAIEKYLEENRKPL